MIKVTFEIDASSSENSLQKDKAAIDGFFNGLIGTPLMQVVKGEEDETVETAKEEPKKRKRRTAAEIAEEKAAKDETKEDSDDGSEGITYEELASEVAEKIKQLKDAGKNPSAIVKKLKDLGATKLDQLEEDKYETLLNYIKKLK